VREPSILRSAAIDEILQERDSWHATADSHLGLIRDHRADFGPDWPERRRDMAELIKRLEGRE